ncbi:phosphomannomutase/phosphoglucomutase [Ruania rhizosphaerae]|uniref:phosphomannomutase/phosphoglucomutase n=1 Tax=Ruania rhizosphaerae TaxID=1840413 RepID=UPI00135CD904|nr:phosphomannomutase/phosphoglucomutase [Ruania rhizosphaerae]
MSDLSAIVKAYDVRGVVPDELDEECAQALGAAFADVAAAPDGGTLVAVGYDMRDSSPGLAAAFAEGAAWRGVDVVMIGLCSTDGLYYVSGSRGIAGAMFTASHNPAQYNGIKMCHPGARPVGRGAGLEQVQHLAEQYLDEGIPAAERQGEIRTEDTLADYAQHLRSLVGLDGQRPLKVVIDAGNGMAGLTAGAVLGTEAGLPDLGLEIVPMYFELDGTFPNHEANPLDPDNLIDLQTAVIGEQADIGLAFDGDADRCFVIDERGVAVNPSAVTALVGLRELEKEKAAGREATVIHNLITSRAVPELIEAAGGRAVRTRVGHSFIKAQMAEEQAVFGGEHSAHYYFRDFWFADTGMLAAMHVLQALGSSSATLSELSEIYTPYYSSGEINSRVSDPEAALQRVRDAFADDIASGVVAVEEFDGVTFSHWDAAPRWWFNLRSSNTEPLLRLNVEAHDEDILAKITDGVLAVVREGQEDDDE